MDTHCLDTVRNQLQSNLFGNLSAEIRSIIWTEIVLDGGHNDILHITSKDQCMSHIQCSAPEGGYNTSRVARDSWGTEHEHCYFFSGMESDDAGNIKQCGIFPLLLSCQRISLEASEILYSVTRFSLIGPLTASRFLSTISPQDSSNIRRLTLTWMALETGDEDAAWKEAWNHITALPNLRSLHVALYDCYTEYLEERLLAPMMQCRAKDFVVDLPWCAKEGVIYEDPPFLIVRPKPGEDKTYESDNEISWEHPDEGGCIFD